MGWVNMDVVMWIVSSRWYNHCRWATSTVMWECMVVMKEEALSVGGQSACEVSIVLCQVCVALPCWVLHAIIGATMVVVMTV